MFLDDDMSSSRRNEKHLKVTFAKFAAAAAAAEAEDGGLGKIKTERGRLSRDRNNKFVCSGGHHACFRSLVLFALQRCLKRLKKISTCQLSSSLWKPAEKTFIETAVHSHPLCQRTLRDISNILLLYISLK